MALNDKVQALLTARNLSFRHFNISGSRLEHGGDDPAPVVAVWNTAVLGAAPTVGDGFTAAELVRMQTLNLPVASDELVEETRNIAFELDADRAVLVERL